MLSPPQKAPLSLHNYVKYSTKKSGTELISKLTGLLPKAPQHHHNVIVLPSTAGTAASGTSAPASPAETASPAAAAHKEEEKKLQ